MFERAKGGAISKNDLGRRMAVGQLEVELNQ